MRQYQSYFISLILVIFFFINGVHADTVTLDRGNGRTGSVSGPSQSAVPGDDAVQRSDNTDSREESQVRPANGRGREIWVEKIKVLPDLSVSTLSISPLPSENGKQKVLLEVLVKNSGDEGIRGVLLRFRIGNTRQEKSISLGANSDKRVKATMVVDQQRFTVYAIVDPANKIDELDEKNNRIEAKGSLGIPLTQKNTQKVTPSARKPATQVSAHRTPNAAIKVANKRELLDLSVDEVKLTQNPYHPGEVFTLLAKISNKGNVNLTGVDVTLYIDQKKVDTKKLTIGHGKTKYLLFKQKAGAEGSYKVTAVVDPLKKLQELSKNNNSGHTVLKVSQSESADPKIISDRKHEQVPAHVQTQRNKIAGVSPARDGKGKSGGTSERDGGASKVAALSAVKKLPGQSHSQPRSGKDIKEIPTTGSKTFAGSHEVSCFVGSVDGSVLIDPVARQVKVQVKNDGTTMLPELLIGIGLQGQAKMGKPATWLATQKLWSGAVVPGKFYYVTFTLPESVQENTQLVAGVDIEQKVAEQNETDNVFGPFTIKTKGLKALPLPAEYDLQASVSTTNGVHTAGKMGVRVKVSNKGTKESPPCKAGLSVPKGAGHDPNYEWLGSADVPPIHPGQHVFVKVKQTVQTLNQPTLVVKVDSMDEVNEGSPLNEQNNYSQPFQLSTNAQPEKPFQPGFTSNVFSILNPDGRTSYQAGAKISVLFYLDAAAEKLTEYQLADITLLHAATNAKLVLLAEEVPVHPSSANSWTVTLPAKLQDGDYRIRISSSQSARGVGTSKSFRVYKPKVVKLEDAHGQVQGLTTKNSKVITKIENEYAPWEPINISMHAVSAKAKLKQQLHTQAVDSVVVTFKITSNKEFILGSDQAVFNKAPEDLTTKELHTVQVNAKISAEWEEVDGSLIFYSLPNPSMEYPKNYMRVLGTKSYYSKGDHLVDIEFFLPGIHQKLSSTPVGDKGGVIPVWGPLKMRSLFKLWTGKYLTKAVYTDYDFHLDLDAISVVGFDSQKKPKVLFQNKTSSGHLVTVKTPRTEWWLPQ
ncbi:MAG: hypothetical protein D6B25_20660 [Desulfobulbaceae bacterium]|nr:MAG: hypothetical protein D6B25_20660 [Desulfobulbaceae bacterium]